MGDNHVIKNFITTTVDKMQKSGNSTFYPNTISAQRSIKAGWLRKQGSVVKSWKRRWFTLKGDQLYYFISEDESKPPQGVIALPGNDVAEISSSQSKPDEFLFEIFPGKDKNKVNNTHESYLICASSDEERKAWIQVIKKVMFSKMGGAIFGQSLEETLLYEQRRKGQRKIPELVESCVEFLTKNGLDVEGIFRLPGRTSLIRELKEKYDRGSRPTLSPDQHDVQTIASLLKLYLRELPTPLLPTSVYESITHQANREFRLNEAKAIEKIAEIVNSIPPASYNLLQYVCSFLYEVAKHSDVNKMTVMNLATVFVHCVIRPEDEEPTLLMATASNRTQTVYLLITHHTDVFKVEYSAHGSLIAVDKLLDLDNSDQEERQFEAFPNNAVYSSVIQSSSGKTLTEEVLDKIDFNRVANLSDEHLQQPISPLTTDENVSNRVRSRDGRVFRDFLERSSSSSDDDMDGPYTAIEELPNKPAPPPPPVKPTSLSTASGDYSNAGNDHYYLAKKVAMQPPSSGGGDNRHQKDEVDGYSYLPEGSAAEVRPTLQSRQSVCDDTADAEDEEDYSTLADYTSMLREKSSQMYDGEKNEPATNAAKSNSDYSNVVDSEGSHDVTEIYSKVVRKSQVPKSPSERVPCQANDIDREGKKENAPPIPPKRPPVPSPRRSIKAQSVFFNQQTPVSTDQNKGSLTKAQSVDDVYSSLDDTNIDFSRRFNSVSSGNSTSRGNSVRLKGCVEELISKDLSEASREELLSHIEALHNELLDSSEKMAQLKKSHKRSIGELAAKLDKEKNATQGAVDKVMSLQKKIEHYQMKFGPVCD